MTITRSKYWWAMVLVLLVVINLLSSVIHSRLDLTQEKRYTLSEPTKRLLRSIHDQVNITVLLDGEMPAGFKKLRNTTSEMLAEFREYGKNNVSYRFVKPGAAGDSTGPVSMDSLMRMGLRPTNVRVQAKEGEGEEQRYLFPGALISYRDKTIAVDFFQGVKIEAGNIEKASGSLNRVEALLEYKLISAIQKVVADSVPVIGYVTGNGEPLTYNEVDFIDRTLKPNYGFGFLPIDSFRAIPPVFNAIVIVKPTTPFTDAQKLKIDQYIMHGGRVIWMIDRLYAEMDSLMRTQSDFVAYDRGLNLDDQLFKYGVRVNPDLVQDLQCDKIPLVVGNLGDKPQMQLTSWYYFPLLSPNNNHPITRNLDNVLSIFPNSLDTIKVPGIRKTILLSTSPNARSLSTPAMVSLNSVKTEADLKTFNKPHIPVAVLLEGKFSSPFANRLSVAVLDTLSRINQQPFVPASIENKMIVIADADIVTNVVSQKEGPLEMGYNQFTQYQYANKDFILNCLEYLVNPSGVLETRSKDFTLRLLDPEKVESERNFWRLINIGLPVLIVILFGFVYQFARRRKYQHLG